MDIRRPTEGVIMITVNLRWYLFIVTLWRWEVEAWFHRIDNEPNNNPPF